MVCYSRTKEYIKYYKETHRKQLCENQKRYVARRTAEQRIEHSNKDKEYRRINHAHVLALENAAFKRRYKKNPKYWAIKATERRIRKLKATPSFANLDNIRQIYLHCPEGYQVDHIIPLRGKSVSGLHVEGNLQYLPGKENSSKGNKFSVAA